MITSNLLVHAGTRAATLLLQGAAATQGGPADALETVLRGESAPVVIRAVLTVAFGLPALLLATRLIRRWVTEKYSAQQGMVTGKLLLYAGLAILVISVLNELGFSLAPLLGAAGIVGIALGFASQTSVSNVISGFFLMAEQPFRVDDVIQVGTTVGRVLSIDMLSVKLRTFDNKYVRIPNESLIKSEVINITRFPIRRLDVPVGVAYKEDAERVRAILREVADENPLCLMDPEPMIRFEGFGESSVNFTLAVWAARENWLALKNSIQENVKARLDAEGIEIPFPHRTLYMGTASEPFPVRIVQRGEDGEEVQHPARTDEPED
ncbi:MAG: mechanosensitive ion channel [Gemmatimonadetes bacterium]|nr:mechanosensitive ion channel family protein [Gemmatimonadota bacterium]NIR80853.1 mechanosensitive ion channel family protein [Gemmatimonadota bacterium]NIT89672.1 mechanosensitive ion channel family protein [Gemmatimonadota bacterium]NIU33452.1 mechanosensitive ion channel family protein [Gemmatimonadota bacterium]NIU37738.1 mechanosensitive ion channel [Gemmatimonadota bacterium]